MSSKSFRPSSNFRRINAIFESLKRTRLNQHHQDQEHLKPQNIQIVFKQNTASGDSGLGLTLAQPLNFSRSWAGNKVLGQTLMAIGRGVKGSEPF